MTLEQQARQIIDDTLTAAGWVVQDFVAFGYSIKPQPNVRTSYAPPSPAGRCRKIPAGVLLERLRAERQNTSTHSRKKPAAFRHSKEARC